VAFFVFKISFQNQIELPDANSRRQSLQWQGGAAAPVGMLAARQRGPTCEKRAAYLGVVV